MLKIFATATTAATIITTTTTTNSAIKSAANIATGRAATTTAATATTTGWPSGINGLLNNMFLNPEDPGSIPGEEHGKI